MLQQPAHGLRVAHAVEHVESVIRVVASPSAERVDFLADLVGLEGSTGFRGSWLFYGRFDRGVQFWDVHPFSVSVAANEEDRTRSRCRLGYLFCFHGDSF